MVAGSQDGVREHRVQGFAGAGGCEHGQVKHGPLQIATELGSGKPAPFLLPPIFLGRPPRLSDVGVSRRSWRWGGGVVGGVGSCRGFSGRPSTWMPGWK